MEVAVFAAALAALAALAAELISAAFSFFCNTSLYGDPVNSVADSAVRV